MDVEILCYVDCIKPFEHSHKSKLIWVWPILIISCADFIISFRLLIYKSEIGMIKSAIRSILNLVLKLTIWITSNPSTCCQVLGSTFDSILIVRYSLLRCNCLHWTIWSHGPLQRVWNVLRSGGDRNRKIKLSLISVVSIDWITY